MRNAAGTLALFVALGAGPAAAVDLNGPWRLTVQPSFMSGFSCPAEIVQVGTAIALEAPGCLFALSLSGTIDPETGAFSGSGPTTGAPLCPSVTVTGTGGQGSDEFWGSFTCTGGPIPVGGTFTGGLCGNGSLDAGEQCDDGDVQTGDCCSHACEIDAKKTPCGPSGEACSTGRCDVAGTCVVEPDGAGERCFRDELECTDDVCDGTGACIHPSRPVGDFCSGDFNACTDGACDGAGACVLTNNTAPCDDFNSCTEGDVCDGTGSCTPGAPVPAGAGCEGDLDRCTLESCDGAGTCAGTGGCSDCCGGPACTPELASCKGPTRPGAKVRVRSQLGVKDRVDFQWKHGETTTIFDLGDPLSSTDYTLCVFHEVGGSPELAYQAIAPAGGTCAGAPCWRATGSRGFAYRDAERTPDGIDLIKLKVGSDGRASALVKGKGPSLRVPFLGDGSGGGLSTPVTVQLRSSDAACLEATFSTPQRDGPYEFRSRDGQ